MGYTNICLGCGKEAIVGVICFDCQARRTEQTWLTLMDWQEKALPYIVFLLYSVAREDKTFVALPDGAALSLVELLKQATGGSDV